jgi:DNA polymerase III subunit chi
VRIEFYVSASSSDADRARLACRLIDKAWSRRQPVFVYEPDAEALAALDTLLWTFSDGSFIPHERLDEGAQAAEAPIVLSSFAPTDDRTNGILLNFAVDVPPFANRFERVIELIDEDPSRREAGRARFRTYRQWGHEPVTHNLGARPD